MTLRSSRMALTTLCRVEPAQDLVLPKGPVRGASSEEGHLAWMTGWVDEPVPALGGRTPREAVDDDDWALVEALLRRFEFDTDLTDPAAPERRSFDAIRVERDLPTI